MPYSTLADIREAIDETRLVQLTDDAKTGEVDESIVSRAIEDADREIDGYVGSRHAVPLAPVPAIIRKFSVDLAITNLYARREKENDARTRRYDNAIAFLKQVALGKIALGADDPEGNPPASDAPRFSSENPPRLFSRDTMREF